MNILACQQRQIGDALLLTPALHLLRRHFPQACIHLFTEKKCEPLLRHNPDIDLFHLLDKAEQPTLFSQITWYRKIAKHHFDLVVDFQQLPRCRMMTRFSGAGMRLSFPAPWYRPWLYTQQVTPVDGYAAATKTSLLAPFGLTWNGEAPRICLTNAERLQAKQVLAQAGFEPGQKLISVDATHRRASKRWPAEYYRALLDQLVDVDPSLRFLLLRGPGEDEEVEALRNSLQVPKSALLIQPMPDLRLSAACMEQATLHIGGCSAPRHMAVALDVPSLVIPGASGKSWLYPEPYAQGRHREMRSTLPCQPCSRATCLDLRCLTGIKPEQVTGEALEMLGKFSAFGDQRGTAPLEPRKGHDAP